MSSASETPHSYSSRPLWGLRSPHVHYYIYIVNYRLYIYIYIYVSYCTILYTSGFLGGGASVKNAAGVSPSAAILCRLYFS